MKLIGIYMLCMTFNTGHENTITYDQFVNKCHLIYDKMMSSDTLKEEDYIELVKLKNTIALNRYIGKEEVFNLLLAKRREVHNELVKTLSMEITVGMGYYSKKYNLQYGGTYLEGTIKMNSIYLIADQ